MITLHEHACWIEKHVGLIRLEIAGETTRNPTLFAAAAYYFQRGRVHGGRMVEALGWVPAVNMTLLDRFGMRYALTCVRGDTANPSSASVPVIAKVAR